MTTKHTPGTWTVENLIGMSPDLDIYSHNGHDRISEIATVKWEVGSGRLDEAKSNAKLIAAAPDLLKILEQINAAGELALHCGDNSIHAFAELTLKLCKDAIKKATL